jgi:DNA repair protein RadA/Sms
MSKSKTIFVCQNCGAEAPRWEGKCRECNAWNSLVEETVIKAPKGSRGWSIGADTASGDSRPIVRLSEHVEKKETHRLDTGLAELNRVLGGGLVKGSYILLGGDPGIGKSTLLMQMAGRLNTKVLYVSGEESVEQTALRAQRLGVKSDLVSVASESRLSQIQQLVQNAKPDVLIVDSIQTIYQPEITSAPGTVSQVRECAAQLMALAKSSGIAIFLVGHITKDGSIAGPKTLEHMVDTVLSFEGDANYQFRLLRAQKNRFGPTNELGVFQMAENGLEEVANPSEMFLAERGENLTGSAIFSAIEGSRPLLCEMQSLTTETFMAMPRRTSIGFDVNRVHLLAAVLDKQLQTDFARNDVFVNVVGGLKITEPAADLAVAAAMISSLRNQALPSRAIFFGEVGLTGEIRTTTFAIERLREAEKLGFTQAFVPLGCKKSLEKNFSSSTRGASIELQYLKHVGDLSDFLYDSQVSTKPNQFQKSPKESEPSSRAASARKVENARADGLGQ